MKIQITTVLATLVLCSIGASQENVPTRDELIKALVRATKNCNEKDHQQDAEIRQLNYQYQRTQESLRGTLNAEGAERLFSKLLEESVEEVHRRRNDEVVCLSALLEQMTTRLAELERALGTNQPKLTPVPLAPSGVAQADHQEGSSILDRSQTQLTTPGANSSRTRPDYRFPVDEVVFDRLALCNAARLIEQCKDIVLGGRSYHGDLYVDCSGLRRLLVHQKSVALPPVQRVFYLDQFGNPIGRPVYLAPAR